MKLEEMALPPAIKTEAARIAQRIEIADGLLEMATAGGVGEGFLMGLACADTVSAQGIEALEDLFSQVMTRKLAEARKQL
ncbi:MULTISPECIES: hypothetical protein [Pseudomonas syringae group]|uniref:Uncharacterized protein n=3 Tax=Pseudomonas viridiflava TaxID=33069 RepID=A0ABU7N502_PSEVI|nr:hypothetical protein [Pseudomonas viridiflava]MCF9020551.1 hypothetical protein [Pseudomonas syringae]MBI6576095.1 hypothetical protein [Pseudomonas viridiflava]MBI6609296.1 hypothetical protein [Pseudomonas viridiflava]MBI6637764.1 hypothetical protein [Pseudomonas viridiflava]MBI6701617.1 hypothetical protein [Pseudomonas viridiflava]